MQEHPICETPLQPTHPHHPPPPDPIMRWGSPGAESSDYPNGNLVGGGGEKMSLSSGIHTSTEKQHPTKDRSLRERRSTQPVWKGWQNDAIKRLHGKGHDRWDETTGTPPILPPSPNTPPPKPLHKPSYFYRYRDIGGGPWMYAWSVQWSHKYMPWHTDPAAMLKSGKDTKGET